MRVLNACFRGRERHIEVVLDVMLYRWQECWSMCTKVRGMWAWPGVWYRHVTHGLMAFWESISRDSWAILDLVRFPKRICITSISQIIAILRFKLQIQQSKGVFFTSFNLNCTGYWLFVWLFFLTSKREIIQDLFFNKSFKTHSQ